MPRSERASTSRSSASRLRRSVSSDADRSARAQLLRRCRSRRSASSSSVFRLASGVRSSWLASATKPRSRSSAASSRASIALSVSPRRRISSSAGGSGSRSPGRSSLTSGGLPAHRLHRAAVRRPRRRSRRARRASARSAGRRPAAAAASRAPPRCPRSAWPTTRRQRRRPAPANSRAGSPSSTASSRGRASATLVARPLISSGLSSGRALARLRAVDDPALGVEDLGEALLALDEPRRRPPGSAGPSASITAAMSVARERSARSVLSFRLSSKRV